MTSHIPVRRNEALFTNVKIGASVLYQQKYFVHKQQMPEFL